MRMLRTWRLGFRPTQKLTRGVQSCVIDKFVATNIDIVQAMHKYYSSKQVAAVEKPLELAGQMIDACLAKLGIAADEDGLYLG
jgi:hypothetical protein